MIAEKYSHFQAQSNEIIVNFDTPNSKRQDSSSEIMVELTSKSQNSSNHQFSQIAAVEQENKDVLSIFSPGQQSESQSSQGAESKDNDDDEEQENEEKQSVREFQIQQNELQIQHEAANDKHYSCQNIFQKDKKCSLECKCIIF